MHRLCMNVLKQAVLAVQENLNTLKKNKFKGRLATFFKGSEIKKDIFGKAYKMY